MHVHYNVERGRLATHVTGLGQVLLAEGTEQNGWLPLLPAGPSTESSSACGSFCQFHVYGTLPPDKSIDVGSLGHVYSNFNLWDSCRTNRGLCCKRHRPLLTTAQKASPPNMVAAESIPPEALHEDKSFRLPSLRTPQSPKLHSDSQ